MQYLLLGLTNKEKPDMGYGNCRSMHAVYYIKKVSWANITSDSKS